MPHPYPHIQRRYLGNFSVFWQNLDKSPGSPTVATVSWAISCLPGVYTMTPRCGSRRLRQKQKSAAGHVLGYLHLHGEPLPGLLHGPGIVNPFPKRGWPNTEVPTQWLPALAVSILPPGLLGPALADILSVMMSTTGLYCCWYPSDAFVVHDLGGEFHA